MPAGDMSSSGSMRRYIRHPSEMPIQVRVLCAGGMTERPLRDVGVGGVSFVWPSALAVGQGLAVRISVAGQHFAAEAMVAWCNQEGGQFAVGAGFLAPDDRFAARMVEQLCHIESYRQRVSREQGRDLTSEQAAREWIARFAADFPRID